MVADWRATRLSRVKYNAIKVNGMVEGGQRWKPSEERCLKLNIDALVFQGAESFSIGMVLRDHI